MSLISYSPKASPHSPDAMFTSTANRSIAETVSQVVCMSIISEDRSLVVITRGGDIAAMKLDSEEYIVSTDECLERSCQSTQYEI